MCFDLVKCKRAAVVTGEFFGETQMWIRTPALRSFKLHGSAHPVNNELKSSEQALCFECRSTEQCASVASVHSTISISWNPSSGFCAVGCESVVWDFGSGTRGLCCCEDEGLLISTPAQVGAVGFELRPFPLSRSRISFLSNSSTTYRRRWCRLCRFAPRACGLDGRARRPSQRDTAGMGDGGAGGRAEANRECSARASAKRTRRVAVLDGPRKPETPRARAADTSAQCRLGRFAARTRVSSGEDTAGLGDGDGNRASASRVRMRVQVGVDGRVRAERAGGRAAQRGMVRLGAWTVAVGVAAVVVAVAAAATLLLLLQAARVPPESTSHRASDFDKALRVSGTLLASPS
ncbi:hypothetical protein DFH11DRAFT_1542129 [Phellopilus nigrolimitatus]|nr:hypothetical protein DFH11DRAFT_1542129 [Phellopilus nigrolimitatus]